MPGKFITLEGGEGAGKTTNIEFIRHYLASRNINVIVTREPGGTELAEKIRRLLLENSAEILTHQAELLLMFAARSQHIECVIKPALASGVWVLCSRFTDSTYAYQYGGRMLPEKGIKWLESFVQDGFQPDLTLLLDSPVDIGMQRAGERGELDRIESEQRDFFERVRRVYLSRAQWYPERFRVIDASLPLQAVQRSIGFELERFVNESIK